MVVPRGAGAVDVILDVDTGTDDAGALLLAATHPAHQLIAVSASWGNCSREQAAHNTAAVLRAAQASVPIHLGAAGPSGPAPFTGTAAEVMGADGLCGWAGPHESATARPSAVARPAAEMIVEHADRQPGRIVLVALAPLTTVAEALALDRSLPSKLAGLVVMGGAIAVGGNVTPAAESNIAHDPDAADRVVEAFGAPGAMADGQLPRLVPLDVTRAAALTRAELQTLHEAAQRGAPGAALVHDVFASAWPTGLLETGRADVWPAHDLLATWCVHDPDVCRWEAMPLQVDTGGSAAWGATIGDRSERRKRAWDEWREAPPSQSAAAELSGNRWAVAVEVDVARYHQALRTWLDGLAADGVERLSSLVRRNQ
jgi:purine nucleosidase